MAPRILLCCLALLTAAGCGAEERPAPATPASAPRTSLLVRVDPDGAGPEQAREVQVACADEAGGDVSCHAADGLRPADFAPVPDDVACTELFGGPQTATVKGTLDRRPVDARFSRRNGCEIARWEQVARLLEAAS